MKSSRVDHRLFCFGTGWACFFFSSSSESCVKSFVRVIEYALVLSQSLSFSLFSLFRSLIKMNRRTIDQNRWTFRASSHTSIEICESLHHHHFSCQEEEKMTRTRTYPYLSIESCRNFSFLFQTKRNWFLIDFISRLLPTRKTVIRFGRIWTPKTRIAWGLASFWWLTYTPPSLITFRATDWLEKHLADIQTSSNVNSRHRINERALAKERLSYLD